MEACSGMGQTGVSRGGVQGRLLVFVGVWVGGWVAG